MRRTSESSSVCVCWEEAFKSGRLYSLKKKQKPASVFTFGSTSAPPPPADVQSVSMDEQPATQFAFKRMLPCLNRTHVRNATGQIKAIYQKKGQRDLEKVLKEQADCC